MFHFHSRSTSHQLRVKCNGEILSQLNPWMELSAHKEKLKSRCFSNQKYPNHSTTTSSATSKEELKPFVSTWKVSDTFLTTLCTWKENLMRFQNHRNNKLTLETSLSMKSNKRRLSLKIMGISILILHSNLTTCSHSWNCHMNLVP